MKVAVRGARTVAAGRDDEKSPHGDVMPALEELLIPVATGWVKPTVTTRMPRHGVRTISRQTGRPREAAPAIRHVSTSPGVNLCHFLSFLD